MTTVPAVDDGDLLARVKAWVQPVSVDDETLAETFDAERAAQAHVCTVPEGPLPADLLAALRRRVARALAARGAALGVVSDSEFGSTRLPRWDAEIERYEAPHRKVILG